LRRTVSKNNGTTAAQVTAELNIHLEDHFHKNCHELHKSNIHGTAAITKPLIAKVLLRCMNNDNWKRACDIVR
jgi:hypothetical protein